MKGRKPLPTNLKLLRGHPGHRPLNLEEPQVSLSHDGVKPPSWLKNADSKAEWAIQLDYLTRNFVLGENELSLLADYCYMHGEFVKAAKLGAPLNAALISQMRGLRAELGIGPSARSRLKAGNAKEETNEEKRFFG